jgi:hypothetical protein
MCLHGIVVTVKAGEIENTEQSIQDSISHIVLKTQSKKLRSITKSHKEIILRNYIMRS